MFHSATAFNADLRCWDISSVTKDSGMFNGADAFDSSNKPTADRSTCPSAGGDVTEISSATRRLAGTGVVAVVAFLFLWVFN